MTQQIQNTFIVDGGTWRMSVDATSAAEAAAQAFHLQYKEDGDDIEVAPYMEVLDVEGLKITQDETRNTYWFYTPLVMADAGYHGLSASFYSLLEDLSE